MSQHESALERAAPLTGVVFVALSVVGQVMGFGDVEFLGPGEEVAAHYVENSGKVMTGASLGILALPFLVWFMGSLWRRLRSAEDPGRLAATAFGGGVAVAVLLAISSTVTMAAASRADEDGAIAPDHAAALYDVSGFLWGGAAPVALAVVLGAVGLAAIRRGVFPAWFGWVSIVLGVAHLVLPIAWAVFLVGYLWVLAVSIWLTVSSAPAATAGPG